MGDKKENREDILTTLGLLLFVVTIVFFSGYATARNIGCSHVEKECNEFIQQNYPSAEINYSTGVDLNESCDYESRTL